MNIEEYKTIRQEMLQRHKWTVELSFFAVASTGALLSWLSTKTDQTEVIPFLYICVGLGIIGFIFYSYLIVLQSIYNQGSYLAVFHEGGDQDLNYHNLNRFRNEVINKKSDWGRDGRRGAIFLVILAVANIVGPLWFFKDNISWVDWSAKLTAIIAGIFLVGIIYVFCKLLNTKKYMKENMKKWFEIRDKLEQNPTILETTIKQVIDSK